MPIPRYAEARDAWAGPSRYIAAINEGRNILGTRINSQELTVALANMTDAEREAFRIGAVSRSSARWAATLPDMADMTKYLRSPEMRAQDRGNHADRQKHSSNGHVASTSR